MLTRKSVILAAVETTVGTDATPTGANAIQMGNPTWTPLELTEAQRSIVQTYLGHQGSVVVSAYGKLGFEVELAGSGAAGTAPGWGVLMLACGFAETVTPATKVEYEPVSEGSKTLTLVFNNDGVRAKLLSARGTVSVKINKGGIPVLAYEFIGLYTDIVDEALPVATLTGYAAPLAVNKTNTPLFTLHGYAAALESLSIDMAVQNTYRNLPNSEAIRMADRKPTGSVTIEHPTIAQKDYYTAVRAATTGALAMRHGTAAGNIVELDAPAVQLTRPSTGDSDGIRTLQLGLNVRPTPAGDDELKITVR